jgi:hypothetical protein
MTLCLVIYMTMIYERQKDVKSFQLQQEPTNKMILFYTRVWRTSAKSRKKWEIREPQSEKCPYVNCNFTIKRNFFNDITKFDAIIYHRFVFERIPKTRSPHQLYIMMTRE